MRGCGEGTGRSRIEMRESNEKMIDNEMMWWGWKWLEDEYKEKMREND